MTPPEPAEATPGPPFLSIVVPVYNEADRIGPSLDTLIAWADEQPEAVEIIVVDDGSSDTTVAVARTHGAGHSSVRIVEAPHRGKANAVMTGLRTANGAYTGFCDVDLATPLATWHAFRTAFEAGADVAIASREGTGAVRVGEPWYRHAMGRAFNGVIRLLLLPGIHDTQCGFKFFTRQALEQVLPRCLLYREAGEVSRPRVTAFDVELLYIARRLGMRIHVEPVTWTYGEHTKVNPVTDTLQNLADVLRVRWNGWMGRYR